MLEIMENRRAVFAGFILLGLLGLYLFFDLLAAASLNPVISVGFALITLGLGLLISDSLPLKQRVLLVALLVTAVFSLRFVNWDSRKPFLRDFNQVQQGMTTEEVDQIMSGYLKYVSPTVTRTAQGDIQTGTISYRHTTAGWGDADIGSITFAGGRVIGHTYYPD